MFQIFSETEYKKTIKIPIVNDNQYTADVDLYVILKNATGDAGLGDPNVARITIIDDDGQLMTCEICCSIDYIKCIPNTGIGSHWQVPKDGHLPKVTGHSIIFVFINNNCIRTICHCGNTKEGYKEM